MLRASDHAPGLLVGDPVEISPAAALGGYVVLHAGVELRGACTVQDHAVIGKAPILLPDSRAHAAPTTRRTILEDAAVGVGAVVCAGATIRAGAIVGDHALVREGVLVGEGCVLGHGAAIGWGVQLGRNVRVRNNVVIAPSTIVEDDVFLGPGVTTTDANTMDSLRAEPLRGAVLRRGCRIGTAAVILPGVEVGAGAVVGAGSIVTRDVPPGATAIGSPARVRG